MIKILQLLGSFMFMLLAGPSAQMPAGRDTVTLLDEVEALPPAGQAWVQTHSEEQRSSALGAL